MARSVPDLFLSLFIQRGSVADDNYWFPKDFFGNVYQPWLVRV